MACHTKEKLFKEEHRAGGHFIGDFMSRKGQKKINIVVTRWKETPAGGRYGGFVMPSPSFDMQSGKEAEAQLRL